MDHPRPPSSPAARAVAAVLTGDLVASTTAPPAATERAMEALALAMAEPWIGPGAGFARFRGDGWQALVPQPGRALRVALRLASGLRAADTGLATRLSIGIGTVFLPEGAELAAGSGSAFLRSGRALDRMPRGRTWAISGGVGLPGWLTALIPIAEWQAARWTPGQAAVAADHLAPLTLTQAEWAARAGLTRQAWKARLDGSGIAVWRDALEAAEAWDGAGLGDG